MGLVFDGSNWVSTPGGGSSNSSVPRTATIVQQSSGSIYELFTGSTNVPVTGVTIDTVSAGITQDNKAIQIAVSGSGALTADVVVESSNDGVHFVVLDTFSLSGSDYVTASYLFEQSLRYIRARLTAITGTSAFISGSMVV